MTHPHYQETIETLADLAQQSFSAGALSLANNILRWLDERPMTSLETLVIQLRANLKEVRDGIRDDMQRSMRLSQPTDD